MTRRRCYYHNEHRPDCPTPGRCLYARLLSDLGWFVLGLIPKGKP